MRTSPFGRRSNSAGSACPMEGCPKIRARPIDCIPPAKHSDALPLIESTRIASGPAKAADLFAAGVDEPGICREPQFLVLAGFHHSERFRFTHEMTRDAHHHRGEAAGIAAQIDDDPVRLPELVHRGLELRVDGRHPHVEADDAHRAARRRLLFRRLHAHEHGRQVPHRDRLAGFGMPFERKRDRRSASVFECDVHPRTRWTAQEGLSHPPRRDIQQAAVVGPRIRCSGGFRGACHGDPCPPARASARAMHESDRQLPRRQSSPRASRV